MNWSLASARAHRPSETSIRGLEPSVVLAIAGLVMLFGFVVAEREVHRPAATTVGVEELLSEPPVGGAVPLAQAEQRALLLSDEDALYRATLWTARAIYSETVRRGEQELVAWVVRNRVETRYRGESTYAGVVTDPFQFSAFNRGSLMRDFLLSVDSAYATSEWSQAMRVARQVILADAGQRPFPITTRHFYSERSLGEADVPLWALEIEPVSVYPFLVDERRFRFFDRVS